MRDKYPLVSRDMLLFLGKIEESSCFKAVMVPALNNPVAITFTKKTAESI